MRAAHWMLLRVRVRMRFGATVVGLGAPRRRGLCAPVRRGMDGRGTGGKRDYGRKESLPSRIAHAMLELSAEDLQRCRCQTPAAAWNRVWGEAATVVLWPPGLQDPTRDVAGEDHKGLGRSRAPRRRTIPAEHQLTVVEISAEIHRRAAV